jgi:hypothetical protein
MPKSIPIALNPHVEIEIDGDQVARALGLDGNTFSQLLQQRKISQLCERGTEEDTGLYRASFYYLQKRVRLVVNQQGEVMADIEVEDRTR